MRNHGLDSRTADRLLSGEPDGPPELTALLAAASADHPAGPEGMPGEEAAVAAFRRAHAPRPYRRVSALVGVKSGVVALVLLLAGGVAVAATEQHRHGPAGPAREERIRRPQTSLTTLVPAPAVPRPPRPSVTRPSPSPEPRRSPEHPPHPSRNPHATEAPGQGTPPGQVKKEERPPPPGLVPPPGPGGRK
jgi:hypothetical protein